MAQCQHHLQPGQRAAQHPGRAGIAGQPGECLQPAQRHRPDHRAANLPGHWRDHHHPAGGPVRPLVGFVQPLGEEGIEAITASKEIRVTGAVSATIGPSPEAAEKRW